MDPVPACVDGAASETAGALLLMPLTLTIIQPEPSPPDPACSGDHEGGTIGVARVCSGAAADDDDATDDCKSSSYRRGHAFEVIL